MKRISRRKLLGAGAMACTGLVAAVGGQTVANAAVPAPPGGRFPGEHAVVPLPFDAKRLSGLSESLILSHHRTEYTWAVGRLNEIMARLASLPDDAPDHLVGALKREELRWLNSVQLHELYFQSLGGDGEPGPVLEKTISRDFGSVTAWWRDFRRTARSVGGGGWAVLVWSPESRRLLNTWSGDTLSAAACARPLLALDLYEHAYYPGYGSDPAPYIEDFLRNLDWRAVETRLLQSP